ncbi:MAG: pyruvate ferredoxin oxidoreductase [Halieaceae bacterium]|jgi:pyruvate-ferredoxin/flavodoxin oxidoreductase|nr:pyruvate ferredoxin oxidoreductase [Halieaceae bacterium]
MNQVVKGAKYPGVLKTEDGSAAVVKMETAASEAAGAYPITPSTQMGEGWAAAVARGEKNVNGRNLIFFEPEGEHAAAGVTAGMSMVGLRSTNFSSGQGIAYMHESLYAAVGKRLTYVLNVACRAITKHSLNVHAGHDDYHAIDDTGFFQLFAKDVQGAADLNLVAHRVAELSLNPGICAQDGFLTSHVIESYYEPERELIREYLGDPADMIDSPTGAQRAVFGKRRRRIPELYNFDYPAMLGTVQNQESYAQGVAAQRPFYFDHIAELTDQAFAEYEALSGRNYRRVMGYRLEDADYVIVGQGSVICNAEVVADYLRESRGLKIGVLDLVMFRPFPADLVSSMLAGKKAAVVLERTDQPLAVELPLVREIRSAMAQAAENGRAGKGAAVIPYAGLASLSGDQIPDFYSGCFGMGSRDLQPGDIIAAVDNMLEAGRKQRQFYLGIEFIQKDTPLPKMQIWQEQILQDYPQVADLALASSGDLNLLPDDALELRIHSVGGWGAITMGKNLAMTAAELLDLNIKANPKYGSEKKGQPTTFYAMLSKHPLRLNCELKHVNVVLSPDPNVFLHSNPLAGLRDEGVFIIQSELSGVELWNSFPQKAQLTIRHKRIKVFSVDGFNIALSEASNPELRFRMQGVAFLGAFFNAAPLMETYGLSRERLFEGIQKQLSKKFGHLGEAVVDDNIRVITRGFDEVQELDSTDLDNEGHEESLPLIPHAMEGANAQGGVGNQGDFWNQVCVQYKTGNDIIADPFTAISAMPAASASMRDMSAVRFNVPEFVAEKCTGCSKCWVQCPDSAIPGVVNTVEEILQTAVESVSTVQNPMARFTQIIKQLGKESRKIISSGTFKTFGVVLAQAYEAIANKSSWNVERRAEIDAQYNLVYAALVDFPLAKTGPFFDLPESKEKGTGGLLSITINPETCKGCDICVAVCADGALLSVRQTDEIQETLEANWKLWNKLPETNDRYVKISDLDEGIGVLSSLLLKQSNYMSMLGGDGACMGCGEKTTIHLVLSAVNAFMAPRIEQHVKELSRLVVELDEQARNLLVSETDLSVVSGGSNAISVPVDPVNGERVQLIHETIEALNDLKWRYEEGPSGRGRAKLGFTNATGCTSVWGATYPYNPYPFPWVNHLFQDAPSVAVGIFEGHMRKMADGFISVRRAQKLLSDSYDAETDEAMLSNFEWHQFTDQEFALCPPLFAVGGDGAMMDIGFQNLSRVLASDKPIRVMVVDTQVYSNTGGQACTSGFTGQVSDMAEYGQDQRGKEEARKELALISMAHRGVFVMQSSQATPAHLIKNALRGLQVRRPSIFILNTPCPPEWGIADDAAPDAARLALESRAVPNVVFDPDLGTTFSECLDLEGNPALTETWTHYDLRYVDDDGDEKIMNLPFTIADWAMGEARFRKQFRKPSQDDELILFHEYLELEKDEREDVVPYIHTVDNNKRLGKMAVSDEIADLAEERLAHWAQLKEMAGVDVSDTMRDAVAEGLTEDLEARLEAIKAEYERKIAQLTTQYPQLIARRLAEGLLSGSSNDTVAQLLEKAQNWDGPAFTAPQGMDFGGAVVPAAEVPSSAAEAVTETAAPVASAAAVEDDDELGSEPYIDTIRCTSCDDCLKINEKLFVYNEEGQAYINDPKAGTFKQLVMGAEACPAECIHPGDPLNPKEKGLDKLMKRAEAFN